MAAVLEVVGGWWRWGWGIKSCNSIFILNFCVSVNVQILGACKRSRLIAANAVFANLVADLKEKVMPSGYGISAYGCKILWPSMLKELHFNTIAIVTKHTC